MCLLPYTIICFADLTFLLSMLLVLIRWRSINECQVSTVTHQGSQLPTQRAPQTSSLYLADRLKPETTGCKIYIGISAGSLTRLSSGLFIHSFIVVFLSLSAQAAVIKHHGLSPKSSQRDMDHSGLGKLLPPSLKQRKNIQDS